MPDSSLDQDQLEVVENAKWADKVLATSATLAAIIVATKLIGGSQVKWQGVNFNIDLNWIIFTFLTLTHSYVAWLLLRSIQQVQKTQDAAGRLATFREVTAKGGPIVRGLSPRTKKLGSISRLNFYEMRSDDPSSLLAVALAGLTAAAIVPFSLGKSVYFISTVAAAIVIVAANWIIGSTWIIRLSRLTIHDDSLPNNEATEGTDDTRDIDGAAEHVTEDYEDVGFDSSAGPFLASIATGCMLLLLVICGLIFFAYYLFPDFLVNMVLKTACAIAALTVAVYGCRRLLGFGRAGRISATVSLLGTGLVIALGYWLWI